MQKKRSFLVLSLSLFCLLLAGCSQDASTQDDTDQQVDTPYTSEASEDVSVDALCQGEDDVVESVNFTLLTLPRWVRTAFKDSGWSILVVDYDIAEVDYEGAFTAGDVLGSTAYKDREIRILDEPKAAVNAPIHEFGHWLDWVLGYPTMSDEEYLSIYEEEQDDYKTNFGPSCSWNEQEFFAEGFWCYWKSPEALKKICPKFHQYLTVNLNELKAQQSD